MKGNPWARSSAQSSHLCCEALRSWVKKTEKKSLWGQSHQHQFHSHKVLYQHCTYLNIKPSQKITGLNNHPGNFPPLKVCPGPCLNPQAHPSLVPGLQSPAQHRGSESEHCHQQGKEENCWGPRRDSESISTVLAFYLLARSRLLFCLEKSPFQCTSQYTYCRCQKYCLSLLGLSGHHPCSNPSS